MDEVISNPTANVSVQNARKGVSHLNKHMPLLEPGTPTRLHGS